MGAVARNRGNRAFPGGIYRGLVSACGVGVRVVGLGQNDTVEKVKNTPYFHDPLDKMGPMGGLGEGVMENTP